MFRRLLAPALLLLTLAACNKSDTAPAEASSAADAAPQASTSATPAPAPGASAASTPADAASAGPAAAQAPLQLPADAPREGTDFEIIGTPQPTWGQGKIEVAEVFGYSCIHCAEFQPSVNAWKQTLPEDVRFEYVPAIFGGVWDHFGRAYFAAEALGVQPQTHDAVFNAVFVDQKVKAGTPEEIADVYAGLGVDRAKFIDTTKSFGVTARINRAKQFAMRTGVTATPTLIVNGKYRINVTPDRGFPGMLATANFLVARERAEAAGALAPAAAQAPATAQ